MQPVLEWLLIQKRQKLYTDTKPLLTVWQYVFHQNKSRVVCMFTTRYLTCTQFTNFSCVCVCACVCVRKQMPNCPCLA